MGCTFFDVRVADLVLIDAYKEYRRNTESYNGLMTRLLDEPRLGDAEIWKTTEHSLS
jgi:hypothetical protein